jgi:hypothetical protein
MVLPVNNIGFQYVNPSNTSTYNEKFNLRVLKVSFFSAAFVTLNKTMTVHTINFIIFQSQNILRKLLHLTSDLTGSTIVCHYLAYIILH